MQAKLFNLAAGLGLAVLFAGSWLAFGIGYALIVAGALTWFTALVVLHLVMRGA